jgi:hypothetical protein
MIKRSFLWISATLALILSGCLKDTYNMSMLSKQAHLSPTLAISAVKGDISLSDAVKSNDTIVYGPDKFVTLIFRKDSIVDLKLSDFSKGTLVTKTATIDFNSFDLNTHDILSHISGVFLISNPTLKFNYTNSFTDSIKVKLNVSGTRKGNSVNLNLLPFALAKPNVPVQKEITTTYIIDKTNSNLPQLISLPPEAVNFSGIVTLTSLVKSNFTGDNVLGPNRLTGSLELDVPLQLRITNLQFTDTVDNFIKDKGNGTNNPVKPEDFQMMQIKISASNGFPLGASMKMSLYDSATNSTKSTVSATDVLEPAAVDSNGKATTPTKTSTSIDFTKDFFSFVNKTDKIIFSVTFQSTGNGSQDVKIYSDYRINFNASLVVKPDINLK